MGVSGKIARGAYWWAGGADRININCETGRVRIAVALDTPVINTSIIKSLTTTTVKVDNSLEVSNNIACKGSISAEFVNVNELGTFNAAPIKMYSDVVINGTLITTGDFTTNGIGRVKKDSIVEAYAYEFCLGHYGNVTANALLTYANMRVGIITCLNVASGLTLTFPLGTAMQTGMGGAGIGQSFKWSIINTSTSTGNITIATNTGHSYIGYNVLITNQSFRFLTILAAANTAVTYRIAN